MPSRGGTSRAWLRAAFALDSTGTATASARLPPVFLCPAVSASLPYSTFSRPAEPRAATRLSSPTHPWPRRSLCDSLRTPTRRGIASTTAPVDPAASHGAGMPLATETPDPGAAAQQTSAAALTRRLPLQCSGCGAFSQTTMADQPGYFDLARQSTRAYLGLAEPEQGPKQKKKQMQRRRSEEDRVVAEALQRLEQQDGSIDPQLAGLLHEPADDAAREAEAKPAAEEEEAGDGAAAQELLCVRCHELLHHSSGQPIFHPDLDAIRATLAESPYKYNHVYHVIDAADFPMSLLPRIHELLDTMPLRSRNRRARHSRFYGGRRTELSFVVTRADLLAPRKDQVDRLMPWIRETLRDALGRAGRHVRLGNVRCVSARRSWWTAELREEIWQRGGANWLVGKANVGKSYLVHHVFPKGRMAAAAPSKNGPAKRADAALPPIKMHQTASQVPGGQAGAAYAMDPMQQPAVLERADGGPAETIADFDVDLEAALDETALLPPRPRETNFPALPVVSALAGTTASPIRIPFGGGKGELIDLPGLARTGFVDYVDPAHRDALVLKTRVARPEQIVLKGGARQSLLLGGSIRITPRPLPGDDGDTLVFLAYNFTPLQAHRTMTEKAVAIQAQTSDLRVASIAAEGAGAHTRLAGSFPLRHDVTKVRAGPITRRDAAHIRVDRLPYRVLALDLLIEGCGWVEIAAQVRTRHLFREGGGGGAAATASSTPTGTTTSKNGILQTLDLSDPDPDEDVDAGPADTEDGRGRGGKGKDDDLNWPVIDVYSPDGRFVAVRRPLNAWTLAQPKASIKRKRLRARPKKSMKGVKKQLKAARRMAAME